MRIAFIGDSFVNGTGDPKYLGWAGRVCRAARARGHDVTCYNLGIRRDTSADVAARWAAESACRLLPEFPALFVFSFGVNDCVLEDGFPRLPPERTLDNLRTILKAAAVRAPCLFVGPPPTADEEVIARLRELCPRMAAACGTLDVPYLPSTAALLEGGTWVREAKAGDGAHPGAAGYDELAALVDGWAAWRQYLP